MEEPPKLSLMDSIPLELPQLQLDCPPPRRTYRPRVTSTRRQGGECQVLPDKDVWLELVMRSLTPENVPMLPPVEVTPPKSTAMSYSDFDQAQHMLAAQKAH
eukprot:TRINITY_DN1307_c0_g4_i1.p1 TRINITY_DN1307_c0_g4~~TRINITY_DN1307_c0_g4_i1.p1  ORF type:complete len:112 (+),score=20.99 TRINITY_DN1307_c0_g4_i1:33-338(+)